MADVAIAHPFGLDEHGVLVAVNEHVAHREPITRRFALGPELVGVRLKNVT